MHRIFSCLLMFPVLVFVSCPAEKAQETIVAEVPEDHPLNLPDTGFSVGLDPNLVVLPQAMLDAMTDSGSYNLDMTKTGFWTEYKINLREDGGRIDTIFQKHEGHYDRDLKTRSWSFYESRSRKLPMEWDLTEVITFRADKYHGVRKVFKQDRLFLVEHFKGGELDSTAFYYDDFGNLVMEVNFRQGDKHGKIREFYVGGKVKSEVVFDKNVQKGPYKHFYPSGILKEEGTSEAGKAVGTWKLYHTNGRLWTERFYKDGLPWNVISNLDDAGNVRPAGSLKNGNGTLFLYNDAGRHMITETYQDGIKISEEKLNP